MRKLILHTKRHSLNKVVIQHLQEAGIDISAEPAPDTFNTLLCTEVVRSWLEASGLRDKKGRVKPRRTCR